MISIRKLRERRNKKLGKKQDTLDTVAGLLGRASDETVLISGRPGYVYVRIGNDEKLGTALNKKTQNRYDLPVILGYDGISKEYQVIASRQDEWTGAGFSRIPDVEAHRYSHEWPDPDDPNKDGSDVPYVHWRQIRGLRIGLTGTVFEIEVDRWVLLRTTGWQWVVSQQLDLSGDKPASGARYALIYLDKEGILQRSLGSVVATASITVEDCPVPSADDFPLAMVMLWAAQTDIVESTDRQDILDLRWPQAYAAGSGMTDDMLEYIWMFGR